MTTQSKAFLFYISPPSLFSGFPFPSLSTFNLCSGRVCPPLASVFPFFHAVMEMAACSHTDLWTESWPAEVTLVYLSHRLVCFPPYTTHGEWNLTILRHSRRKILHPEVMQFISIKMFHIFSWMAPRGPRVESMQGLLDGHHEHAPRRGSGSVLSWLNMGVWWWLQTICFCQSTKLQLSLSVIDELVEVKWIEG